MNDRPDGTPSTMTSVAPAPAPPPTITAAELVEPFQAGIDPVRVSVLYRMGLLIVTVAMVLLPVVYVGFIVLLGWGLWYHVSENITIFEGSGGTRIRFFVYVTPIVVGAIAILFMIKPLFAPRGRHANPVAVDRHDHPVLFTFVEHLCRAVGAPVPKRIDVDTNVNASASFRGGFGSLVSNDLVLTIGLPLVAGLNLRQLTGVLAHEFGHFAQKSGMGLTYLIRRVNGWFARVVYERDGWDEKLEQWSRQSDARIAIILHLARFMVWLSRRVLWVLMVIGHFVSCFMLRQMEYDADRYEARVAGSDTFAETAKRLPMLALAHQGAHQDLAQSWQENRLADNLPLLVTANYDQLRRQPEAVTKISQAVLQRKTGFFDTHPAERDRIASAGREKAPGIFRLEQPASVLFGDFGTLSSTVTLDYYRQMIGEVVSQKNLVPTAGLVKEQMALSEGDDTLFRYFRGKLLGVHKVFLPEKRLQVADNPSETLAQLKEAQEKMVDGLETADVTLTAYEEAEGRLRMATVARNLMAAKLKFPPKDFGLDAADADGVNAAHRAAMSARKSALDAMNPVIRAAQMRLTKALQLLGVQTFSPQIPDADRLAKEVARRLDVLGGLKEVWPKVNELQGTYVSLGTLLQNAPGNESNQACVDQIRLLGGQLTGELRDLRQRLAHVDYPYAHADGSVTVATYAIKKLPRADDLGEIMGETEAALERIIALYFRILADLVVVAEKVETAAGLQPLPLKQSPESLPPSALNHRA